MVNVSEANVKNNEGELFQVQFRKHGYSNWENLSGNSLFATKSGADEIAAYWRRTSGPDYIFRVEAVQ